MPFPPSSLALVSFFILMHFDFLFIAGFSFYRHFSLHSSFILIGFPHKVKMWLTAIDSFWSNYWFARFIRKNFCELYPILYLTFFFYIIFHHEKHTQCPFISSVCKMYSYIYIRKELLEIWKMFDLFSNPKSVKFMNSKSCIYLYFTCGGFSFNNRSVFISRFIVPLGNIRKFRNDKKVWIRP